MTIISINLDMIFHLYQMKYTQDKIVLTRQKLWKSSPLSAGKTRADIIFKVALRNEDWMDIF